MIYLKSYLSDNHGEEIKRIKETVVTSWQSLKYSLVLFILISSAYVGLAVFAWILKGITLWLGVLSVMVLGPYGVILGVIDGHN